MAKFSRKGWNSDFNPDNFTCDQMDRHVEGLRDDLYGRHNPVSRPGKTIHPHKPVGEAPREFTSDELFATMVEAAKNGDCQRQFLAGLGYAKRGDMKNAKYWLKKAADRNWPEAREKFDELFGTHHVRTCHGVRPHGRYMSVSLADSKSNSAVSCSQHMSLSLMSNCWNCRAHQQTPSAIMHSPARLIF